MKKKYIYSVAAALLLGVACYQLGRYQESVSQDQNRVAYVEGNQSSTDKNSVVTDTKNMSPDEVSAKEGIDAEQIVVKITDQGYVTSHGDHYHYYNGKVPYDAIISEELILKDSSYILNQADIVNEVKDGYIIKREGRYYLYLKDASKTSNVRTKEEISRQQQSSGNSRSSHATNGVTRMTNGSFRQTGLTGKPYTTDDGYVFSPTDVIDDMGDGFLVPHGDHFHYIPKKDLSAGELAAAQAYWDSKHKKLVAKPQPYRQREEYGRGDSHPTVPIPNGYSGPSSQPIPRPTISMADSNQPPAPPQPSDNNGESLVDLLKQLYAQPLGQRHVEGDGLVFDPVTITKRTDRGVVVPHGDHFHFIPFDHMSELEAKISKMVVIGMAPVQPELPSQPSEPIQSDVPSQPSQPTPPTTDDDHGLVDLLGKNIKKTAKGMDGLPYTTSDGYTFTAESILEYDDQGLRAEHGDHEHYVFYHELEDSELEAAQNYINRNHLTAVKPSGYSKSEIEAKLRYVSLENGVPFDQLIVTGNQVIIPHGNHSHVGNLDRYPVALRLKNDSDVDEYRSLLVSLKMSYLRLQNEGGSVYRRNDVVVVVQKDGIEREVKLKDIRLPLDYDEVDYSGLVTAVDPNEEKLAYIAKQYGVPRHEVRYLFDNLVMIEGHGAVDLSLVNVKDAVIYSLRNQPQDTKTEEDKGDGDEKVQEQPVHTERVDSEQTLPDSTVQDKALSTLQPEHQSEPEIDHSSSTDDGSISQPSIDSDSEEEEEIQSDEDSEELDEYELAMRERAKAYGMAADDFEEALVSIALKHSVGVESFEYQPEQKTVSFLDRSGQRQVVKVGNN
ncbi:hypothetical protein GUT189_15650 [Streptococcus ruminantium]|nr:pneumococcal-type histidine triad protein [Streptococcus ruminantium]BDD43232.1 hypothetical protein GUT189_15650 [Streptococcus ruminantium]